MGARGGGVFYCCCVRRVLLLCFIFCGVTFNRGLTLQGSGAATLPGHVPAQKHTPGTGKKGAALRLGIEPEAVKGAPDQKQHVGDQQGGGKGGELPADLRGRGRAGGQAQRASVGAGPPPRLLGTPALGREGGACSGGVPSAAELRGAPTSGCRIMSCPNCW